MKNIFLASRGNTMSGFCIISAEKFYKCFSTTASVDLISIVKTGISKPI